MTENERPSSPTVCTIADRAVALAERIGEGGMADVFRGHLDGQALAIKVMKAEWAFDGDAMLRFAREVGIVEELRHPAVPAFFGHGVLSDGRPFAAFAEIDGQTLRSKVSDTGALSVAEALALLDELLEVLTLVHQKGVLHRDIKLANIVVDRCGNPFLLDFGLAQLADLPSDGPGRPTLDGLPIGTPEFMAPEQALTDRDAVGPWTDLFALALTVAYALAGRSLRSGATRLDQLFDAQMPLPPLGQLGLVVPADVETLLQKALAYAPEARFRSAAEMQRATRIVARSLGIACRRPSGLPGTQTTKITPSACDPFDWLPVASPALDIATDNAAPGTPPKAAGAAFDAAPPVKIRFVSANANVRRKKHAPRAETPASPPQPRKQAWPAAAVLLAGIATGFLLAGLARVLFG